MITRWHTPPPCDSSAWAPSDVATVIIAVVAVLVSVASVLSTVLIHHYQGPVIRVTVRLHAELRRKATYKVNSGQPADITATVPLKGAKKLVEQYSPKTHYYITFLRAVVTNVGRTDAYVDNVMFVNSKGAGRAIRLKTDPPYPLAVSAGTYITKDDLYSEVLDFANEDKKIRFEVKLTNGTTVKSKWIKLDDDLRNPQAT